MSWMRECFLWNCFLLTWLHHIISADCSVARPSCRPAPLPDPKGVRTSSSKKSQLILLCHMERYPVGNGGSKMINCPQSDGRSLTILHLQHLISRNPDPLTRSCGWVWVHYSLRFLLLLTGSGTWCGFLHPPWDLDVLFTLKLLCSPHRYFSDSSFSIVSSTTRLFNLLQPLIKSHHYDFLLIY